MYFRQHKNGTISAYAEEYDVRDSEAALVEWMSNSVVLDVIDLLNDGYPVNLGNDYAEFLVAAYDRRGGVSVYGIGPDETRALCERGQCHMRPEEHFAGVSRYEEWRHDYGL